MYALINCRFAAERKVTFSWLVSESPGALLVACGEKETTSDDARVERCFRATTIEFEESVDTTPLGKLRRFSMVMLAGLDLTEVKHDSTSNLLLVELPGVRSLWNANRSLDLHLNPPQLGMVE